MYSNLTHVLALPETGGSSALTVVSGATIALATAVAVTTVARLIAKKAYKA